MKVISIVSPYVGTPKNIAVKTWLLHLLQSSRKQTEHDIMSQKPVRGFQADQLRRRNEIADFYYPDDSSTPMWLAKTITFRGKPFLLLRPLLCNAKTFLLHYYQRREPVDTCYTFSSALFNEVAASMVQAILQPSVSLSVTSVTRGCAHGSEVYAFNSSGDFRHVFMT